MSAPEDLHLDPDLIAVLALGETAGGPDDVESARHLTICETCRGDVADLARVVDSAKGITPADVLLLPPASVWTAIAAEFAPPTVPVAASRRAPWLMMALAACLGLVLGGGAVFAVTGSAKDTQTVPLVVIAAASLAPLPGSTASGHVQVVSTEAGPRVVVDVSGLGDPDGFYEVWLLDRAGEKLVALGALDASSRGSFAMPKGVSMSDFPVVDISLQPANGNPEHSHHSLVRGTLPA